MKKSEWLIPGGLVHDQMWPVLEVFTEYCPGNLGVYGCCLKNFVVDSDQSNLKGQPNGGQHRLVSEELCCCPELGISGSQAPSPELLYRFPVVALQMATIWERRSRAYVNSSAGFVGQWSWQLSGSSVRVCHQAAARGWPGLGSPWRVHRKDGVSTLRWVSSVSLDALGFMVVCFFRASWQWRLTD